MNYFIRMDRTDGNLKDSKKQEEKKIKNKITRIRQALHPVFFLSLKTHIWCEYKY